VYPCLFRRYLCSWLWPSNALLCAPAQLCVAIWLWVSLRYHFRLSRAGALVRIHETHEPVWMIGSLIIRNRLRPGESKMHTIAAYCVASLSNVARRFGITLPWAGSRQRCHLCNPLLTNTPASHTIVILEYICVCGRRGSGMANFASRYRAAARTAGSTLAVPALPRSPS